MKRQIAHTLFWWENFLEDYERLEKKIRINLGRGRL
jgi:hypothetical protein